MILKNKMEDMSRMISYLLRAKLLMINNQILMVITSKINQELKGARIFRITHFMLVKILNFLIRGFLLVKNKTDLKMV